MQPVLIDKITVPAAAKAAFTERINANRHIIKQQPGFINDELYEQQDADGNLIVITIAHWENAEILQKARETVQAEYKRTGFNLQEFCQQQHITIERGIYNPMKD